MTLSEIQALIVSVDPLCGHYESAREGAEAYTVWREVSRLHTMADDSHAEEGWAFQVDRFSKREGDAVAEALFTALDADERVAVSMLVDYEQDTGYIHHIFDCSCL